MKTRILNYKNQQLKLVIDESNSGRSSKDFAVIAVATIYEGLGVWTIEDIRLSQYSQASPYFNIGADQYWASYTAPDVESFEIAKSLLKETFPQTKELGALEINYCTFDGLVRGKTPEEMGVAKHRKNPSALLFTRKEVNEYFKNLIDFWREQPINEDHPEAKDQVSKVKIDNHWRQDYGFTLAAKIEKIKEDQEEIDENKIFEIMK